MTGEIGLIQCIQWKLNKLNLYYWKYVAAPNTRKPVRKFISCGSQHDYDVIVNNKKILQGF